MRIYSSSCGTHRDVVHCAAFRQYHRCCDHVFVFSPTAQTSAAPMCSVNVCVAMSCGGGSFSPDGAYDSLAVMEYVDGVPMMGIPDHQHISAVRERTLRVQLGRLHGV